MFKLSAEAIGGKLRELADFEVNAAIDTTSTLLPDRYATYFHGRLLRILKTECERIQRLRPRSMALALEEVRYALIEECNLLTAVALSRALKSCKRGYASGVTYRESIATDEEHVLIHEAENPFNDGFEPSLSNAIRLRGTGIEVQRRALAMGRLISGIRELRNSISDHPSKTLESDLEAKTASFAALVSELPTDAATWEENLEFWNFRGAMSIPWSFPRHIDQMESVEELKEIADNYDAFGVHLGFHLSAYARGAPDQCARSALAWSRFNSSGLALRVIAGWLRALSTREAERHCSICYRHVSSRSRCHVHATKSHETRDGRLGKRIQPLYRARLKELESLPDIRHRINYGKVFARASDNTAFQKAAHEQNVKEPYSSRIVALASQLSTFHVLLNQRQRHDVEMIFLGIINAVQELQGLPAPRTLNEIGARQEVIATVTTLTSMKGFLLAWFGKTWPPKIGSVQVETAGVDRRHPVVRGASISQDQLARNLIAHRAWMEVESEFIDKYMPDRRVIAPLKDSGLGFFEIAQLLGVSHTTVRTNLARDNEKRERNRLKF